MAFRSRAIGREKLLMLRGVLDRAAGSMGVLRGSKEHEELAVRLLQLTEIIADKDQLFEVLSNSGRLHPAAYKAGPADTPDRTAA